MSSDQSNPLLTPQSSVRTDPPLLDQRLAIDTPEQIRLEYLIAGVGSRFLAIAIDTLIQIGVGIALALVLLALGFSLRRVLGNQGTLWLGAGAIFLVFLLNYGYFLIFEWWWNGQTPGKRAIGIRAIKESGRPLNAVEIIGRNLMRIVDQLPFFYAVGVLSALLNSKSKRLGDFVAGSIIVREKPIQTGARSWEEAVPSGNTAQSFLGASQLGPQDYALVEAFLSRRSDLDLGVRHKMAREILNRLEQKLQLSPADRTDPDGTLERLLHEYRQGSR